MSRHPAALVLPLLLLAAVLFVGCTSEISGSFSNGDCEGKCDDKSSVRSQDDSWKNELIGIVDTEYQRLSTYASNDGGWGACVSTWTVSGAAIGEVASKTCTVIGVATAETGVGAVAAAVCVAADASQADALLGAAIGYLSGYLVCSAAASFPTYLGGYKTFNLSTEADTDSEEDGATSEVEDWNTPACRAQYDEYKAQCKQERSCKSQELQCVDFARRYEINTRCAQMRQDHLYDCPHPSDFDWGSHENEVGNAFLAAQNCQTRLCNSNCQYEIQVEVTSAYGVLCSAY